MVSTDPTVKNITVNTNKPKEVEEDATDVGGGSVQETQKRKTRKNKKKKFVVGAITKEGGGSTSPGTMTQLAASHLPGAAAPDAGLNSAFTQSGRPYPAAPVRIGGGAKAEAPVKVVLAAPKKAVANVQLAAAKNKTSASQQQKRKTARKIRVSMRGLSRKIHRAKKIHTEAKEATLDQIRAALHKAGLLANKESKAPESMLRQMYADYLMLKNRAL